MKLVKTASLNDILITRTTLSNRFRTGTGKTRRSNIHECRYAECKRTSTATYDIRTAVVVTGGVRDDLTKDMAVKLIYRYI